VGREKKKILFIASEPSVGMVPFGAAIINSFQNSNYDVFAITVSGIENTYSEMIQDGVVHKECAYPTSKLGKLMHKFFPLGLFFLIRKMMKANGIKNVHFLTGEYGFALFLTRILKRRCNLVYTVHDLEMHPYSSRRKKDVFWVYFFHKMTLRNIRFIDNLVTCSKKQALELAKMYPQKKVIYHDFPSIVTTAMKNGNEICSEVKDMTNYVLFFGTFSKYKGVDLLYEAFLNLKRKDVNLVFAGKGGYELNWNSNVKNVIHINRFIKDEEIADLFRRAKIVVYPYIQATMSGVLTIAHFFKKRVLASDVQFFRDNIESDDVLFECGNVTDLENKLDEMLSNEIVVGSSCGCKNIIDQMDPIYL